MSREFRLAWNCPHLIGEERVNLATDRRSLYTSKPIGGIGALRVVANDTHVVYASTGIQSQAVLESGRREPFQIVSSGRVLTVATASRNVTVTLSLGYLSAADVARTINAGFNALGGQATIVASASNGYLLLSEQVETGPFSKVLVTGTAQTALGFDHHNGTTGRVVIPSWGLYSRSGVDPTGDPSQGGYFLRFNAPVRGNYYFGVTYTVNPLLCLRCRGTEVENDYRFDAQSNPLMVTGNNLLYQSCSKIILTAIRSNIYYPWYGTNLQQAIGTKALSGSALALQQTVRTALTSLQNLQAAQAQFQRVSATERLYAVDQVLVTPSPVDPTVYLIEVSVRSYSDTPINITIVYTAPGSAGLSGTNGLSLGVI